VRRRSLRLVGRIHLVVVKLENTRIDLDSRSYTSRTPNVGSERASDGMSRVVQRQARLGERTR
jgi:hypothetical protein